MLDIRSLSCLELETYMRERGLPEFRGRQLFKWLWKNRITSVQEVTEFSKELREQLAQHLLIYNLEQVSRKISVDGTIKWAFRLRDSLIVETVLIPEKDHSTLCISSQAGCAMGCAFCLTGKMGFFRNLDPSEIAGQALAVLRDITVAKPPRNIVFMGMGEPLANFENLLKAIEILTSDLGLNFSQRRITVSTCGIVPNIIELGRRSSAGLAISLHATTNTQRDRLMPINKAYPIETLLNACRDFNLPARRRITFEYLLLKGINDAPEDARRLSALLRGIPSKINLIPFNECPEIPFSEPERDSVLRFQEILKELNNTVIIRKSKGRDISAACGQLFYDRHDKKISGKDLTGCLSCS
ncbi:MAG: 23S rRNA (adenine(2503)-C(2))-methyltransferase RlmN [Thermodesulfatator sp.]|nr:MAG: 23S rRNA (adenine(2503)-C(2))-methyltransferase RlmN [Thermodesulfatator sp.]